MENKDLICPICGEPTSVYMGNARKDRLCRKHGMMLKNGEIEVRDDGLFIDSKTKKVLNTSDNKTTVCTVCGENSDGKDVCASCFKKVMHAQNEIDKNKKKWELKDYYYTLKAFIGRLKGYEEVVYNVYKLYAIAWLLKNLHKDDQLVDVVNEDAKTLLELKKKLKEFKPSEKQQQNDKTIIAVADIEKNRASDGHICKSEGEVIIDDILFKYKICHAYERKVKEIPSDIERTVIADWFIPTEGMNGIYIEYWGMNTQDYQDNKEEKLKLYEQYKEDVKLIQINKNDIQDRQNLEDRIYQELKKLGWKK